MLRCTGVNRNRRKSWLKVDGWDTYSFGCTPICRSLISVGGTSTEAMAARRWRCLHRPPVAASTGTGEKNAQLI
ncbi:MAG TPA: hypothetical protein VLS85_08725 [Hanamia sp.]|nr:hypothetical protein [Hanamia sp.]